MDYFDEMAIQQGEEIPKDYVSVDFIKEVFDKQINKYMQDASYYGHLYNQETDETKKEQLFRWCERLITKKITLEDLLVQLLLEV